MLKIRRIKTDKLFKAAGISGHPYGVRRNMRKILQTLSLMIFVVLATASFGYAQFTAVADGEFPFFHLGCLVVGGLIIISLKHRYSRLHLSEAIGSFALYAVLVSLFTPPVVEVLKTLVG
jgi:hypothetical protein